MIMSQFVNAWHERTSLIKMDNPRSLGSDAYVVNPERLTFYDNEITKALASPNALIWRELFGTITAPFGARDIEWNYEIGPYGILESIWGKKRKNLDLLYAPKTNKFYSPSATLALDRVKIAQAALGGTDIEAETIRAIVEKVNLTEDYALFKGFDNGGANHMKGVLEFTGVQDAGAPTGVWDVVASLQADILKICGKLDAIGYDGPIDLLMDSGLKHLFRPYSSDGVTTFDTPVMQWVLKQLAGGRVLFNDYFSKVPTGQVTGISYSGAQVTAGANHYCVAIAKHPANKVVIQQDLKPYAIPAEEGDVHRNYVETISLKIGLLLSATSPTSSSLNVTTPSNPAFSS